MFVVSDLQSDFTLLLFSWGVAPSFVVAVFQTAYIHAFVCQNYFDMGVLCFLFNFSLILIPLTPLNAKKHKKVTPKFKVFFKKV